MPTMWEIWAPIILPILGLLAIPLTICGILLSLDDSPFKYPYKNIYIDISGRRSPKTEDLIEGNLIECGLDDVIEYYNEIEQWKEGCQEKIRKKRFWRKKLEQKYLANIDDDRAIVFVFTRSQVRYRQVNYNRYSYTTDVVVKQFNTNLSYLEERYSALEEIDFECTLSQYHSKNQRKLMTPRLRSEIAERDNYTCQICGKYMPDGVGLHIDHIIPIAKGGKSVPSNLQVLCSKCNGRKSSK